MWILKWLPNWLFYLTFFIGIFGTFITSNISIPYKTIIKAGFVGLLLLSVYMMGGIANNNAWLLRVQELEAKVALAEEKSASANAELENKVVTKIKTIKETVYVAKDVIREVAGPQIDANCTLPVSSIVLHNSASRAEVARGPSSVDGTPSGVAPSALLTTVVENYGNCHENAEKLKAWQQWYLKQKQIYEGLK